MKESFIHFSEIDPLRPETWEGKRILSLDVDWAPEPVLENVIERLKVSGIKFTLFVTHESEVLKRNYKEEKIEWGLHPDFNPLLKQEKGAKSPSETIAALKEIVPQAEVLRSHSMTHSGSWLGIYKEAGITHLSQYYLPDCETISPIAHLNGIVEAPVYFADDGLLFNSRLNEGKISETAARIRKPGSFLKVLNFHPIHVFLNSGSMEAYTNYKTASVKGVEDLSIFVSLQLGISDLFAEIVS